MRYWALIGHVTWAVDVDKVENAGIGADDTVVLCKFLSGESTKAMCGYL